MNRRSHSTIALVLGGALALLLRPGHAHAADPTFVPPSECKPMPCTCADGPAVEDVLNQTKKALDVWMGIYKEFNAGSGPLSAAAAKKLFRDRFAPQGVREVGGVNANGEPVVDPGVCMQYCAGIVTAIQLHELAHPPTILKAMWDRNVEWSACKAGLLSDSCEDLLEAEALIASEVQAHAAEALYLEHLQSSLLDMPNPQMPQMMCTWKSIVDPPPTPGPTPGNPLPISFRGRLRRLWERAVEGR